MPLAPEASYAIMSLTPCTAASQCLHKLPSLLIISCALTKVLNNHNAIAYKKTLWFPPSHGNSFNSTSIEVLRNQQIQRNSGGPVFSLSHIHYKTNRNINQSWCHQLAKSLQGSTVIWQTI